MATAPPSNTPFFSSTTSLIPGSSGRPSTSSLAGYSPNFSQGIGYSPPTPASPASSGIPSFRLLRSLLPFGPNKNAIPVSLSASPNLSRSPFGAFGSVRRSITKERERKVSLSNDATMPVISIEKSNGDPCPANTAIRRSVSLSTLDKPLPSEPNFEGSPSPFGDNLLPSVFTLRTPSPGPPLSAELSTIIEADNSGVSKHITANSSPTAKHTKSKQEHNTQASSTPECDVDASALDLSTTHLADQVRDAIREGDSLKEQWLNADKAVVIVDGDEHPDVVDTDTAFNMDSLDRDLADLLNPHSAAKEVPLRKFSAPNKSSPTTPKSPASPASRLPRARQTSSFLPRLRSSNSPSLSPHTPSPATPKAPPSIVANGNDYTALKLSSSPASPSIPTSTPIASHRSTTLNQYRPSLDFNTTTRPSFDGIIRPNSAAPLRDRDGRRTPSLRVVDADRASPIPKIPNAAARMRKRSMSVQERFGRGRVGGNDVDPGLVRCGSSLSAYGKASCGSSAVLGLESGSSVNESGAVSGPKMEWLGPRTVKAFRAAGLMDFGREKERDKEEGSEPTERLRDRSSSTSVVLSPSPLGVGNPASTLNRFASLRSASEYNPTYGRSHSRPTLSESGTGPGMPRRGSESFSAYGGASSYSGNGNCGGGSSYGYNELMESPTFTVSSGSRERDTPKSSVSTAPTSLADSFGYLGRDRSERDLNRERERDRERDEMREMKEKHGTEMGALLGALSDSQRTVRVLREENSDLRDRLERLTVAVQANQELRQVCGDLQSECSDLRRENTDMRKELVGLRANLAHSWIGNSSGMRTPVPKTASSPLARTFTSRIAQEEYDDTFIDHGSEIKNHLHYLSSKDPGSIYDQSADSSDVILPSSSSISSNKRRLSDSSSIFPIPPSNMTLLLHEDTTSTLGSIGGGNRSSADHSQYGFSSPPASMCANSSQRITHVRSPSQSPPISYRSFAGNMPSTSVTSVGSISPTTVNFSIVTGSPGSLFLRPEHEILLGDMESLDLGAQGGDGEMTDGQVDGW